MHCRAVDCENGEHARAVGVVVYIQFAGMILSDFLHSVADGLGSSAVDLHNVLYCFASVVGCDMHLMCMVGCDVHLICMFSNSKRFCCLLICSKVVLHCINQCMCDANLLLCW